MEGESPAPGGGSQPAAQPAFPWPHGLSPTCARPLLFWPQFPLYEIGHHLMNIGPPTLQTRACTVLFTPRHPPSGSPSQAQCPVKKPALPGRGLFTATRRPSGPGRGFQTLPRASRQLGDGETSCPNQKLAGINAISAEHMIPWNTESPLHKGEPFEAGILRPGQIPTGVSPNSAPPIQVDQEARSLVDVGGGGATHTLVVPVLMLGDLDQVTAPLWAL